MLTSEQINNNKNEIINLLHSTNREGIQDLILYLMNEGFFTQATSTKYHQSYQGGLAEHSLSVYKNLSKLNKALDLGYKEESMIIASLLHDLCKIDAYNIVNMTLGYQIKWNPRSNKGHAKKSIELVNKFIHLTEEEEYAIKFHMGAYEKNEFDWNELGEGYRKYSMAYYIHVADMQDTYGF